MSKDFYKNPIFIKVGILVVTAIILFSLIWLIYSKDQPKIVPPETRGKIREGVKEEIVKPIKSVFPGVGESLSNAEYKPSTTPGTATNNNPVLNNETADWQTYQNEEIGYSLKYPENWAKRETNNNNGVVIFSSQYLEFQGEYPQVLVESFAKKENYSNLSKWLDENKNLIIGDQEPSNVPGYSARKPVKYNDISGLEFSFQSMGEDRVTVLNFKNSIIIVNGLSLSSFAENSGFSNIYYSILSTFK